MKTTDDDDLLAALIPLVKELAAIAPETSPAPQSPQEGLYRRVLTLAIRHRVKADDLREQFESAGVAASTASEILTIYQCLKQAGECAMGNLSVRLALSQARQILRDEIPPTPEELRFHRAADKVLEFWPKDIYSSVNTPLWRLEFRPVAVSKSS
jgi:hypothetical protein